MASGLRKSVCIGLLFFVSIVYVFASGNPLSVLIKPTSESVKAFRYQSGPNNNGLWTEVDISLPVIVLEGFDSSKDVLYVQQTEDLVAWSDSYRCKYNPTTDAWDVFLPIAIKASLVDSLEVKLYGLYPYGKSATYYSYVFGAGYKMNIALGQGEKLIGYGEVTYSRGPSETDWVETMQAIGLSIGIGYKIPLNRKMQVTPEIGYGVLFHLLDADFDEDGAYTLEVFADQQVRLSLNLCFALGDNYELFCAPLGVLFFEDGNIGTMFGCQSGLRFNF